jgi:hypothetical protein
MFLPLFIASSLWAGIDKPPTSRTQGSSDPFAPHLRLGLHASTHDLSPLLGLELSNAHLGIGLDGWIRPFYWKTMERQSATRWTQYRILRYGFNPSLFALLGDRKLGLMPMAGLELVFGDIAGSSTTPSSEAVPWAGLGLAFASRQHLDMRIATKEGVLGWVRGEWVVAL